MSLAWLRFVPKNHLSALIGRLAHIPLPRPLNVWLIKIFIGAYRIDPTEASRPLHEYRSIGEFFVRDLRPELRPLPPETARDQAAFWPVDGTLRGTGAVENLALEQIKGRHYRLDQLLGVGQVGKQDQQSPTAEACSAFVSRLSSGRYFNLYLAPHNYHQVHAPVSGRVIASTYIPGMLWPVNDWSLSNIDQLFTVNERLVTYIETAAFGLVAVVMVGALNVGCMTVSYDNWQTNRWPWESRRPPPAAHRQYPQPRAIRAGDKLGVFHLGSTVVLIVERGIEATGGVAQLLPQAVRCAEQIR